jgi:putative transposase
MYHSPAGQWMAQHSIDERGVSVALACRAFSISQRCFRYVPLLVYENEETEDWLIGLTKARKNWGFGLCYLYLRNIKGLKWNHKRVRRIYCELELNLRIKPRKRLKRERPEPLSVPEKPNQVWSMDFMSDQLRNGKTFRTLNIIDLRPKFLPALRGVLGVKSVTLDGHFVHRFALQEFHWRQVA